MSRIPQMPFNLKLIDTSNTISKKIVDQLYPMVVTMLGFAAPKIKTRIQKAVELAIFNSETYRSLINGDLRAEFGFVDGQPFADMVKDHVVNGIEVHINKLRKTAYTIKGSLYVGLVGANYKDLLNSPLSSYTSKGGEVEWLEWLLLAGTQIVIVDHHIVYSSGRSVVTNSRSGEALMHDLGTYSVPARFAGTKNDNWITRAIMPLETIIEDIIQEEIEKAIP